jgi:hypothetical protein
MRCHSILHGLPQYCMHHCSAGERSGTVREQQPLQYYELGSGGATHVLLESTGSNGLPMTGALLQVSVRMVCVGSTQGGSSGQ